MALKEIKFKVQDDTIAKDIIKASLNRELMLLKKSLSKTKEKLGEYERKNKMSSDQFYRKFYDNAPHHPEVGTYPHHKHRRGEEKPEESNEVVLTEILEEINEAILD